MLSLRARSNAEMRPIKNRLGSHQPFGWPPTNILVGPVYGVTVPGNRTTIPCALRPHE